MYQTIYAIRDNGADIYITPLLVSRNDVVPVREFTQLACNPESTVHQHAVDFELHAIANIDIVTGEIEPFDQRRVIARAVDIIIKPT